MKELFIFFTTMMWIDLFLTIVSKTYRNMIIEELKKFDKDMKDHFDDIKKLFSKKTK